MINSSIGKACLLTGISFGTAWAIRGHFGHEHGATWAAAIGVLALIVVANRADWYNKAFNLVLAGALGWGISGGIMSYGMLIGYSHAPDFLNTSYGLLSLFVVGGLYGCLGGGLVGLALSETDEYQVDWSRLVVEMGVGGLMAYFFMIIQFEWFMTPPRDENWAFCVGSTLMLFWHLRRNGHTNALKVALWSALGAGFGFSSGNFMQVLSHAYEIKFNFWNVMEYSIGFWGGVGMAYGVFTTQWPVVTKRITIRSQWFSIIFFSLIVPFIVWDQSIYWDRIEKYYTAVGLGEYTLQIRLVALALVAIMAFYYIKKWLSQTNLEEQFSKQNIVNYFLMYLSVYTFNSFIVKSAFFTTKFPELYLYIPNVLLLVWLVPKMTQSPFEKRDHSLTQIGKLHLLVIAIVLVLSFIAIQTHGPFPKMELRFQ